jgi:hypothetical protein
LERGHTSCQGPRAEQRVREETARRLISFDDLVEAYRWTQHPAELADELWVTVDVVQDRLGALNDGERRQLASLCARLP